MSSLKCTCLPFNWPIEYVCITTSCYKLNVALVHVHLLYQTTFSLCYTIPIYMQCSLRPRCYMQVHYTSRRFAITDHQHHLFNQLQNKYLLFIQFHAIYFRSVSAFNSNFRTGTAEVTVRKLYKVKASETNVHVYLQLSQQRKHVFCSCTIT